MNFRHILYSVFTAEDKPTLSSNSTNLASFTENHKLPLLCAEKLATSHVGLTGSDLEEKMCYRTRRKGIQLVAPLCLTQGATFNLFFISPHQPRGAGVVSPTAQLCAAPQRSAGTQPPCQLGRFDSVNGRTQPLYPMASISQRDSVCFSSHLPAQLCAPALASAVPGGGRSRALDHLLRLCRDRCVQDPPGI